MSDLINQVEAVLFSVGKKVEVEHIRKLCRIRDPKLIEEALEELAKLYETRESALQVVVEGNMWRLSVRDKYAELIRKILPEADMSRTVMETLAVIAWKQPILQAEVIRIRTNKAYEHVKELTEMGWVTSEKFGRTKKLKLTQKFLDYFQFKDVEDIRELFRQIKEQEHADLPEQEPSKASEVARLVDGIRQAVAEESLVTHALEEKPSEEGSLGGLKVYDAEPEKEPEVEGPVEYTSDAEIEKKREVSEMMTEALGSDEEEPEEDLGLDDEPETKEPLKPDKPEEEPEETKEPEEESDEEDDSNKPKRELDKMLDI